MCGGYTSLSWTSTGYYKEDADAFVFSLTESADNSNALTFKPLDSKNAVYHNSGCGPNFGGNSLSLKNNPLNGADSGYCYTNGKGNDNYRIPVDFEGNSVLTGEGKGKADSKKTFTCLDYEVFTVTF